MGGRMKKEIFFEKKYLPQNQQQKRRENQEMELHLGPLEYWRHYHCLEFVF